MQKLTINKRFLIIIFAIALALIGWWVWLQVMPRPLGDKLEYIGKTHSGYVPFISDSRFSTGYYYGTDMKPREIAEYFKGFTLKEHSKASLDDNPTAPINFSLYSSRNTNPINIFYYPDSNKRLREFGLPETEKEHVVIIQDEDYDTARNALN